MQVTTHLNALGIMSEEVGNHTTADKIGSNDDYAHGLLEGLLIGMNLEINAFLAIHGTEQRLRHYVRQSLIRQKLLRDPSAPPAGVA